MVSVDEPVVGELSAVIRLSLGFEKLRLVLTDRRLIVSHLGKRGVGALAAMPLLGKLSVALEALVKGGGESSRRKKLTTLSPDEVLSADPDNFFVNYDDIVSVWLEETPANVKITVLTRENKYDLLTLMAYVHVEKLFRDTLGDKVKERPGPVIL